MTTVFIVATVVGLLMMVFGWALCAAAKQADDATALLLKRELEVRYPPTSFKERAAKGFQRGDAA